MKKIEKLLAEAYEDTSFAEKEKNTLEGMDVIFEITRRCNKNCEHCLRGNPECVDMSPGLIARIINMFSDIATVVITGGEPALNIPAIELIYDLLMEKFGEGNLPSFYLVTNGTGDQLRLAEILLKWWANSRDRDLEYGCRCAISQDIFHGKPQQTILKGLAFYDDSHEHPLDEDSQWIISEGRGVDLYSHEKNFSTELTVDGYIDGDKISARIDDMIYISAQGEVLADCDLSFEDMYYYKECDINELRGYVIERLKGIESQKN